MRSNSSDTAVNSAPSPVWRASAKRAASKARGPSTIAASWCKRVAVDRSPNCVTVCKHITSGANCPLLRAVSAAARAIAIASDRALTRGDARPGECILVVKESPAGVSSLIKDGKRGGGLIGQSADGQCNRAVDLAPVAPAVFLARGEHPLVGMVEGILQLGLGEGPLDGRLFVALDVGGGVNSKNT